ncbi:PKD domain-containing protein [Variovorax saccharolyticus]|uniref:PKD domain-containing protein n=1 Tax=Variovorax saccharolyticus TaxID=3053516 RepID=UPI002575A805|nr:PKD domain-containing protein [Variovorax sp. J31P216]MDM0029914.1 PKD domain-containing protein [Variovorax sp. J31P216]
MLVRQSHGAPPAIKDAVNSCTNHLGIWAIATGTIVALVSCGGGGSGPFSTSLPTGEAASGVISSPSEVPGGDTPPRGHAGSAQSATTGMVIALDGSASTDPEGAALSYAWTLSAKPVGSNATLKGARTAQPGFRADLPGTYIASLTVNDGHLGSDPVSVEITVTDAVAFDSMPAPFPPNMLSYGFQAQALASLGDHIVLAPGTPRTLKGLALAMSSWACENGAGTACTSSHGSGFDHPITVRISDDNGAVLATHTQIFHIPYRPSADPTCASATQWRAANGNCYNGFAFKIAFDLALLNVTLPEVINFDIAYDTNTYGASPYGQTGAYDSLNVGAYVSAITSPSIGSDAEPGFVRRNGIPSNSGHGVIAQILVGAP